MPERRASLVAVVCLIAGCTIGTPRASVVPEITPRPTPLPTLRPSSSAEATSTPVPSPTPTPDPTLIDLEAVSCNGGVLLDWSASTNPDFHHYSALRSPDREIAPDYPPVAPAVDWGDTYTTDRFVTTAVDASILPSARLWYYRVMAYDAGGRAIAASTVRGARLLEPADLGSLEVARRPRRRDSHELDPVRGRGALFQRVPDPGRQRRRVTRHVHGRHQPGGQQHRDRCACGPA